MAQETRPVGRPSMFTPELANEICKRIASSPEGLRDICAADDMPNPSTVYDWLFTREDFAEQYAQARAAQSEVYVQHMVDTIIDAPMSHEGIAKARLYVDTLKWASSKLKPKKYGDSTYLRGDKDNPIMLSLASALDGATQRAKALAAPDDALSVIDVTPDKTEA